MSVKTLRRQLIAAIAMVLVAVIALSSSTFAWFANNTSVTAAGMSITAQSEGANLEIAWTNSSFEAGKTTIGTAEASADSATITKTNLLPTHYVKTGETNFVGKTDKNSEDIKVGSWVHTFSNAYNSFKTDNYTYEEAQLEVVNALDTTNPATTNYALVVPIYLRMNPNSNKGIKDLTATATISTSASTTSDQKMLAAARVLYVTDANGDSTMEVIGTGAASGVAVDGLGNVAAPAGSSPAVRTIYAVIYIDGEDASCTSENYNTNDWTVSIAFNGSIAE